VCNTGNIPSALAAGFSQAKIDHVLDPSLDYFSEQELAILDLGDQIVMHHVDGSLTPDLHARLAKYFDDGEILELGLIAAILTGWTKLMFVFDLVTREDSCPIPNRNRD
jgi:alkylhydroperoxidase family enzyme